MANRLAIVIPNDCVTLLYDALSLEQAIYHLSSPTPTGNASALTMFYAVTTLQPQELHAVVGATLRRQHPLVFEVFTASPLYAVCVFAGDWNNPSYTDGVPDTYRTAVEAAKERQDFLSDIAESEISDKVSYVRNTKVCRVTDWNEEGHPCTFTPIHQMAQAIDNCTSTHQRIPA